MVTLLCDRTVDLILPLKVYVHTHYPTPLYLIPPFLASDTHCILLCSHKINS